MQKHEMKQESTIVSQSKAENNIRLEFVEFCKEKFVADNVHLKEYMGEAMKSRRGQHSFAEMPVSGDIYLTRLVGYLPRE